MCLVGLAVDQHPRFALVLAANRDEYFERPTAPLGWWPADSPSILGGRDLKDGGTWLGLTSAGRLALVTNIRRPSAIDPQAHSRGAIVPQWLRGDSDAGPFCAELARSRYNPFNLIAADLRRGECWWTSSDAPGPHPLGRALYGLSNASLDTPWPKVQRLKAGMRDALAVAESAQALTKHLFAALSDTTPADDDTLPRTDIPIERERQLSSAFISMPDRRYGTRCSTLLITERVGKRCVTHVLERSFLADGSSLPVRRAILTAWPPRNDADAHACALSKAVEDAV